MTLMLEDMLEDLNKGILSSLSYNPNPKPNNL